MKTNINLNNKFISMALAASLLNSCSFINVFSPSPYQLVHGKNGNKVLRDAKGGREEFKAVMDRHIRHEVAKDHVPGAKNHDWHAFWMSLIRLIKSDSENPQWYVDYIIETRRGAGLRDLQ